jgi:toxin FitB
MPIYLLDTNVLSELVRPKRSRRVVNWMRRRAASDLYLSAVTLGELTRGIERIDDERLGDAYRKWLEHDIRMGFAGRIVPYDKEVAWLWGHMMARRDRIGRPPPVIDSQIAATARYLGAALVTRNVSDFEGFELQLINPWQAE